VKSLDKQCNTVLGCNGGVNTTMFAPANARKHSSWLLPSNTGHGQYVSRYCAHHYWSFTFTKRSPWRGV